VRLAALHLEVISEADLWISGQKTVIPEFSGFHLNSPVSYFLLNVTFSV